MEWGRGGKRWMRMGGDEKGEERRRGWGGGERKEARDWGGGGGKVQSHKTANGVGMRQVHDAIVISLSTPHMTT